MLDKFSLKFKMMLISCITLTLLSILSIICYFSVVSLEKSNFWVDHTHKVIEEAMEIEAAAVDMETGMRGFMLAGKEAFLDPYKGGSKKFTEKLNTLKETVNDNPAQVKLLEETAHTIEQWKKNIADSNIRFRRKVGVNKTMDDVAHLIGQAQGKQYFDKFRGQIAKFRDREMKLMNVRRTDAEATAKGTNWLIVLGSIATIVISLLISLFLTGSITRALGRMTESLTSASVQTSSASTQLASAAQELSSGANEQASSIEETSSSLEEMSGMVENNVSSAEKAVELSNKVLKASEQGNESMNQLQGSMKEILSSNEKIEELVKVIGNIGEKTQVMDEIVFQTKLLSFNASVEAERAGEHGRGFAVVAQEVGNLAQMSGKAAQEIAGIVKDSIQNANVITNDNKKKVEQGNSFVQETAKILKEIVNSSITVSDGSNQILSASKDQASGIKQINEAMGQLDKATQGNAATAEETASTSEELSAQTETLDKIVKELNELVKGRRREVKEDYQSRRERESHDTKTAKVIEMKKFEDAKEEKNKADIIGHQQIQMAKVANDDNWEKL